MSKFLGFGGKPASLPPLAREANEARAREMRRKEREINRKAKP